jgi:predicted ATPase
MREGLAALGAIGIELRRPAFLALVAEVCEKINQPGEGLSAVAEALAAGGHTGQRYWDAELHRLKGMLTVPSDAESCFLEAIQIARRQRAKSLELRAATSLSRLWANTGKAREAHALLSAIYGEFTEGFDTADLSDAKSLIAQLERRARTSRADGAGLRG